jgi:hypothetical protein
MMRTMMVETTTGGVLLRRAILLLAASVVVVSMAMASPAFARTPFDPEPRLCANGVAQTYGSDLDSNAADALGAFCNLPIKKEVGKGR